MSSHDELLQHARDVLRSGRRELDAATAAKMRSAIDDAIGEPAAGTRLGLRWLVASAAAVACAAVVALVGIDEEQSRRWVVEGPSSEHEGALLLGRGARANVGGAQLYALRDSRIEVPALAPEAVRIDLTSGEVEIAVEAGAGALVVRTPLAEISVIGTRFSVLAEDARTEVRVDEGEVSVRDRATGEAVRVGRGQRHAVERAPAELSKHAALSADRDGDVIADAAVAPAAHDEDDAAEQTSARRQQTAARDRASSPRKGVRSGSLQSRRSQPGDPGPAPGAADPQARSSAEEPPPASPVSRARGSEVRAEEAPEPPATPSPNPATHAQISPDEAPRSRPALAEETPPIPDPPRRAVAPPRSPPPVRTPVVEPPPALAALIARADAARRAGDARGAAALYAEIAAHPEGGPFAEEALFRKAELEVKLGRLEDGLATLSKAERRFQSGELEPERTALTARIHLTLKDPRAAAGALQRLASSRVSLEVAIVTLETARALAEDHPCDALSLASRVQRPVELRSRAESLAERARARCEKSR